MWTIAFGVVLGILLYQAIPEIITLAAKIVVWPALWKFIGYSILAICVILTFAFMFSGDSSVNQLWVYTAIPPIVFIWKKIKKTTSKQAVDKTVLILGGLVIVAVVIAIIWQQNNRGASNSILNTSSNNQTNFNVPQYIKSERQKGVSDKDIYNYLLENGYIQSNNGSTELVQPQTNSIPDNTPNTQSPASSVQLPVTVLSTSDGETGSGMYADKYPSTITITGDSQIIGQLAAYGAAYQVGLGLKGWTGSGSVGVDGNEFLDLHPAILQPSQIGQKISYEILDCTGCMITAAAPYFSSAMQEYNNLGRGGYSTLTIPQGLQVTPISSTLVTYTLPDANGLSTRGVVYYSPGSQTTPAGYAEAEFVLPVGDNDLLNFLVQNFISQGKYK